MHQVAIMQVRRRAQARSLVIFAALFTVRARVLHSVFVIGASGAGQARRCCLLAALYLLVYGITDVFSLHIVWHDVVKWLQCRANA